MLILIVLLVKLPSRDVLYFYYFNQNNENTICPCENSTTNELLLLDVHILMRSFYVDPLKTTNFLSKYYELK